MNNNSIILSELSMEEERDRFSLERKVEQSFYIAGISLKELRDRKLYRSTHKTFEEYCQDRFGFSRRHPYRLIEAAVIIDNLSEESKMCPNWTQNEDDITTIILPTAENQTRPLAKLKPQQQREVWRLAVQKAKTEGKRRVPTAKIVSEVVAEFKESKPKSKSKVKASRVQSHREPIVAVGEVVSIKENHPLFPCKIGTITSLPNKESAIVAFNDTERRELVNLKDLEFQRFVDNNGKVTEPNEGLNYVPGLGIQYYARLDEDTWKKLNDYAQEIGVATLGGAIARLLEER